MSIYNKIGIGFIINGIIMFLITGALFSYMGTLNPLIKLIGEISFICWVPSIILGILMTQIKNKKILHPINHDHKHRPKLEIGVNSRKSRTTNL